MKRGWYLALVALVPVVLFLYMSGGRQWLHTGDASIVLEAAAVESVPASGRIAQLRYRIGELNLDEIAGQRNFLPGDPVYVTLRPGKPYWRAVSVCREYPVVPQGDVALRGEVTAVENGFRNRESGKWQETAAPVLSVRYGIEHLPLPEDGARVPAPVSVRVTVSAAGTAGVDALRVEGRER